MSLKNNKKQDIVLFGAGGFGKEVMWMLEEANRTRKTWNIRGFVDDTPAYQGKTIQNYPVLGNTKWLLAQKKPLQVLCCLGNSKDRKMVVEKLSKNPHLTFPSFIANNVTMSPYMKMGNGCIICSSVVMTVGITIGDFVIINYHATICHDSVIENFVSIYPSVNISGFVHIGAASHIGVGSQILPHVTIGKSAVVGAGAVVLKNVATHTTVAGVPAKPL